MAKISVHLPRCRLEKPRSREPGQPAVSYEHINNCTKDLEERRDLGNLAHVKRPQVSAVADPGEGPGDGPPYF